MKADQGLQQRAAQARSAVNKAGVDLRDAMYWQAERWNIGDFRQARQSLSDALAKLDAVVSEMEELEG